LLWTCDPCRLPTGGRSREEGVFSNLLVVVS